MIDIEELKMKIDIVKSNYLKKIDYASWHKYYMIVSAYYDLIMVEKDILVKDIYEIILEQVILLKANSFPELMDLEKEKLTQMEYYLKLELDTKTLKK